MKKAVILVIAAIAFSNCFARGASGSSSSGGSGAVSVHGYNRADGTHVNAYTRRAPESQQGNSSNGLAGAVSDGSGYSSNDTYATNKHVDSIRWSDIGHTNKANADGSTEISYRWSDHVNDPTEDESARLVTKVKSVACSKAKHTSKRTTCK